MLGESGGTLALVAFVLKLLHLQKYHTRENWPFPTFQPNCTTGAVPSLWPKMGFLPLFIKYLLVTLHSFPLPLRLFYSTWVELGAIVSRQSLRSAIQNCCNYNNRHHHFTFH